MTGLLKNKIYFLYNVIMQKKQPPKFFLLIFILIGLYFLLIGFSPVRVEIIPTKKGMEAQIRRISTNIVISNLKQAVITTSRSSKGGTTYRVELEDFKGYRYPITFFYSSGYESKARLQDTINNSIRNRTEYKNTFRQPFFILFGLIFIFVSVITFKAKKKTTNTMQQKTPIRVQTPYKKHIPQQPESEEEKYNKINNSIIK